MKAKLILENGDVFVGKAFGHVTDSVGELVFNTGMTGYQELLTDPSYFGQIVVATYPLIGNYGVNLEDMQSNGVKVKGFVIKEDAKLPNNWRCELTVDGYLKQNGVVGFKGVDTRHLTKIIRDNGAMKALITTKELSQKEILDLFAGFSNTEAVKTVTTPEAYEIVGEEGGARIAIMDFGIKRHIVESFVNRGCTVKVFNALATSKEILEWNPDMAFLSNGPGDPEDLPEVIETIKELVGKLPISGICLGHQLLGLALGGKTKKLKFGHRGCNQPVKDLEKNKIYISSQNHGYVVYELPEKMELTHVNLNDNTVEGMKSEELNIRCVQFHPEASPGPEETAYIFDDFLSLIKK